MIPAMVYPPPGIALVRLLSQHRQTRRAADEPPEGPTVPAPPSGSSGGQTTLLSLG